MACDHASRGPRRARRVEQEDAAVDLTGPCGEVERRRRVRALPTLYDKLAIKGLRRAAAKDESQPFDIAASDRLAELLKSRADARLHCMVFGLPPLRRQPRLDLRVAFYAQAGVVLRESLLVFSKKVERAALCEARLCVARLQLEARVRVMRGF